MMLVIKPFPQLLLDQGASATAPGHRGRSALTLAICTHGDGAMVSALLAAAGGSPGEGNLHRSARLGRVDAMRLLLRAGANPNTRSEDGGPWAGMGRGSQRRAGSHPGAYAQVPCCRSRVLLPSAPPPKGMTPLLEVFRHAASRSSEGDARKQAMARLLLEAGAAVNARSPAGLSLLHLAFQTSQEAATIQARAAAFWLAGQGGGTMPAMLPALPYTHPLLASPRPPLQVPQHSTFASQQFDLPAPTTHTQLLLDAGLDASYAIDRPLSRQEAGSKTRCVHVAAKRGWAALLEQLARAGEQAAAALRPSSLVLGTGPCTAARRPTTRSNHRWAVEVGCHVGSPPHTCAPPPPGHPGADVEVKDSEGFSPLALAVVHKRSDCARLLLALGADPLGRCPGGVGAAAKPFECLVPPPLPSTAYPPPAPPPACAYLLDPPPPPHPHARAPDIYPSYSRWKVDRMLASMQQVRFGWPQPRGSLAACIHLLGLHPSSPTHPFQVLAMDAPPNLHQLVDIMRGEGGPTCRWGRLARAMGAARGGGGGGAGGTGGQAPTRESPGHRPTMHLPDLLVRPLSRALRSVAWTWPWAPCSTSPPWRRSLMRARAPPPKRCSAAWLVRQSCGEGARGRGKGE